MINKELNALIKIAKNHKVGVRFGTEQRYVVNRNKHGYQNRSKGWIEIYISALDIGNGHIKDLNSIGNLMCEALAHELGHFLIAPLGRRYHTNYGIPSERMRSDAQRRTWNLDETKADIVGNYLLCKVGYAKRMHVPGYSLTGRYAAPLGKVAWKWWKLEGKSQIELMLTGTHSQLTKRRMSSQKLK